MAIEGKVFLGMRVIDVFYALGFAMTLESDRLPLELTSRLLSSSVAVSWLTVAFGMLLFGLALILAFSYEKGKPWARILLLAMNYLIIVVCSNNVLTFVKLLPSAPAIISVGIAVETLAIASSVFVVVTIHNRKQLTQHLSHTLRKLGS
jgi:hypothetical protein